MSKVDDGGLQGYYSPERGLAVPLTINRRHSGMYARLEHVGRIAWIAVLVILVLLVFAPKAGGTRDLMARAAEFALD